MTKSNLDADNTPKTEDKEDSEGHFLVRIAEDDDESREDLLQKIGKLQYYIGRTEKRISKLNSDMELLLENKFGNKKEVKNNLELLGWESFGSQV